MDWLQLGTLIGVIVGSVVGLTTVIIWMTNKIDSDVKSLGTRLDSHAQRIDQLYTMFVDLVKSVK